MSTLVCGYLNFLNWFTDEEGQDLIEYALIAVLISLAVVVALTAVGGQLNTVWGQVQTALGAAGGG
jgi:pilus assembly protein Flp/PilA